MLSLGETGELSPNASAMLRISTLSAWAQLEIASSSQTYITDVINPMRPTLVSMWIAYLRDYAIIRANSEFIHDASSVALDSSYSSLGKEVLLPVSCPPMLFYVGLITDISIILIHGILFSKLWLQQCKLLTHMFLL